MLAVQNGIQLCIGNASSPIETLRRVTAIADKLGLEFALFHKKRDVKKPAEEVLELLVGDVKGKVSFLIRCATAFM